jgi:8-oxo-dGTP pyrophosphatase MutT (NUDIX family)
VADVTEWAGWKHDQKLVDVYTRRIEKAFDAAFAEASQIISEWWHGSITMTRQGVVDTISQLVEEHLGVTLRNLWDEAWYLGTRSAAIAVSHEKADFGSWYPGHTTGATEQVANESGLRHLLHAYGPSVLKGIASTRMEELSDELTKVARTRSGPEGITSQLEKILNVSARAPMIASTEIRRAISVAAMEKYKELGVTRKQWITPPEGACPICKENEAQGPLLLSSPFMGGVMCSPQHPYCRCVQIPAQRVMKARDVPPNSSAWGGGSGMGARSMPDRSPVTTGPDRSVSDQRSGTSAPSMSAGGEPPRRSVNERGEIEDDEEEGDPSSQFDIEGQIAYLQSRESDSARSYPRLGIPGGFPSKPGDNAQQASNNPFSMPRNIPQQSGMAQGRGRGDGDYPPFSRGRPPNQTGKREQVSRASVHYRPAKYKAKSCGTCVMFHDYLCDLVRGPIEPSDTCDAWEAKPAQKKDKIDGAGLAILADDTGRVLLRQRELEKSYIAKDAADLADPNPVEAEHVMNQMRKNYPEHSIQWMKDARWIGPILVPHDRIDYDDEDKWAASHQPNAVNQFAKNIKAGEGHTHPVVMVQQPHDQKLNVIDGHHRTLAYRKLGQKVKAYVGFVNTERGPWDETHSYQVHQGDDPMNKGKKDKAAGKFEFPGGHLDEGETALEAAIREWKEETGLDLPDGKITGQWTSSDGCYRGFVLTIKHEEDLPVQGHDPGEEDPGEHKSAALVWMEPKDLKDNPTIRSEILDDLDEVLAALGVKKTARRTPKQQRDTMRSRARAFQRDQAIVRANAWHAERLVPHTNARDAAHHNALNRFEQNIKGTEQAHQAAKEAERHTRQRAEVSSQMVSHTHDLLLNARKKLDPDFPSHQEMLHMLERKLEHAQQIRDEAHIAHGHAQDRVRMALEDHTNNRRQAQDAMNAEQEEADRKFKEVTGRLTQQRNDAIRAARSSVPA